MVNKKERYKTSLAVDCVVFGPFNDQNQVLLIKRKNPPFQNKWALPGGFLESGETLEQAAIRELEEETGLTNVFLEQTATYSELNRDPRGPVISCAYFAFVKPNEYFLNPTQDASDAKWVNIKDIKSLAFDHKKIIEDALLKMRAASLRTNMVFKVLPEEFTLTQLQLLFECILNRSLDKRNYRKKINSYNFISETNKSSKVLGGRPAKLYTFNEKLFYTFMKDQDNWSIL